MLPGCLEVVQKLLTAADAARTEHAVLIYSLLKAVELTVGIFSRLILL